MPFCDKFFFDKLKLETPTSEKAASITLLRAAFAEPFRIALERNGLVPGHWFRKVRLPMRKLTDPDALIPEKPFWHLINQVAISQGIPDFGSQVARAVPWYEIETLKSEIAFQPDLRSMLTRFCQVAPSQSSIASFRMSTHGETCLFKHLSKPLIRYDIQMEIYHLTCMLDLVRLYTGRDWRPNHIRLMMKQNQIIESNPIFNGCDLVFSQPCSSIEFDTRYLDIPSPRKRNKDPEVTTTRKRGSLKNRVIPLQVISEYLDTYITEENLSLALVAGILDLSPRGAQRLIRSHGSSYRELLNEARKKYATLKLSSGEDSIGDIASQLGYNDQAHFTRAFKRWTGFNPSDFRRR